MEWFVWIIYNAFDGIESHIRLDLIRIIIHEFQSCGNSFFGVDSCRIMGKEFFNV